MPGGQVMDIDSRVPCLVSFDYEKTWKKRSLHKGFNSYAIGDSEGLGVRSTLRFSDPKRSETAFDLGETVLGRLNGDRVVHIKKPPTTQE
jgi:hypothetical protein